MGVYRYRVLNDSAFKQALLLLQACVVATLALISFTFFYEEYRYSRVNLVVFAGIHPFIIQLGRSFFSRITSAYRRRLTSRKVLLIARGEGLKTSLETLFLTDLDGSEIAGVVLPGDENKEEDRKLCESQNLEVIEQASHPWSKLFSQMQVETVIIALPYSHYDFLDKELQDIANQVADVKIIPDVMRYTKFSAGIDTIGNIPVVYLHESPLHGFNNLLKRVVDVFGATIALIVFSPIMLLISILVPFSSPGPVLYRQERMGLDGRKFDCLKFRSMPVDSEAKTGAVWATANDQRATKLGTFLRRTSLDELPQFFNVLRGEMSLVGPRPERPVFVDQFREQVPGYMLRHKVKTGITGWAQVNGWRGSTSIHKRIECDLYYIQNWSLWLDIKILLLTVFEVLTGRNAY